MEDEPVANEWFAADFIGERKPEQRADGEGDEEDAAQHRESAIRDTYQIEAGDPVCNAFFVNEIGGGEGGVTGRGGRAGPGGTGGGGAGEIELAFVS